MNKRHYEHTLPNIRGSLSNTYEERKEWERLCRQYNVDSLYEAIEGCREELEFLVHCAERLEPLPDDDTPALRPRRTTIADHAV